MDVNSEETQETEENLSTAPPPSAETVVLSDALPEGNERGAVAARSSGNSRRRLRGSRISQTKEEESAEADMHPQTAAVVFSVPFGGGDTMISPHFVNQLLPPFTRDFSSDLVEHGISPFQPSFGAMPTGYPLPVYPPAGGFYMPRTREVQTRALTNSGFNQIARPFAPDRFGTSPSDTGMTGETSRGFVGYAPAGGFVWSQGGGGGATPMAPNVFIGHPQSGFAQPLPYSRATMAAAGTSEFGIEQNVYQHSMSSPCTIRIMELERIKSELERNILALERTKTGHEKRIGELELTNSAIGRKVVDLERSNSVLEQKKLELAAKNADLINELKASNAYAFNLLKQIGH